MPDISNNNFLVEASFNVFPGVALPCVLYFIGLRCILKLFKA